MRRMAKWDRHVEFLDCGSAFLRPSNDTGTGTALAVDLLPDKLHPNAAGASSLAPFRHEDRWDAQYIVRPAAIITRAACKLMPKSAAARVAYQRLQGGQAIASKGVQSRHASNGQGGRLSG